MSLEKVNFKKVLVDFTVKSMLNPENKDFYINNLSLEQVEALLTGGDSDLIDCFWSAFDQAFKQPKPVKQIDEELAFEEEPDEDTCPECGCHNYISGVACPNCDYITE